MSSVKRYDDAGGSPHPWNQNQDGPYAQLLARLEAMEDFAYERLKQFPRVERPHLFARIHNSLNTLDDLVVSAWKLFHKKTALRELDITLERLRRQVRKAHRRGYVTPGAYFTWSEHMSVIGQMIGGWIRDQPKTAPRAAAE